MHHIAPGNEIKWYWTQWNIPAATASLAEGVKGVGTFGTNGINRALGYAPPHSKGPGLKTYTITLYALSDAPKLSAEPRDVNRAVLLAAIKDRVLGTAELKVTYTRPGSGQEPGPRPRND
jgi:phosphatidylethanolamine-binding protein (PEBP) family uncharacterized protein